MKILAVDTALGACSAAVLDGDAVLAHRLDTMERGHAEALAPMVQAVMREARVAFRNLDRLAVTTGPGTFTGQRVGMSFMRGLRLALKRPLVGIATLEAMAAAARDRSAVEVAAVLHDARRNEVYVGMYSQSGTLLAPALLPFDRALATVRQKANGRRLALAGTASVVANQELRAAERPTVLTGIVHSDALWLAKLALYAPEPNDVPRPLYLRPPDAKVPGASTG